MSKRKKPLADPPASAPAPLPVVPRNRSELIRFRTKEESVNAMRVFYYFNTPEISMTFHKEWPEGTCATNTATVSALQSLGCTFEWMTEHLVPELP